MPYLKTNIPFADLQQLLKGYGLSGPKLSRVIGCSHVTAKKKIDYPEFLTVGDLDKISRNFHIPMDDIRGAMKR